MSGTTPRDSGATQGYRGRNSTADRALDILLLFSDDRLVLSANEVATHLGVARSTAYRYLQSLTSNGFLEENAGGSGFRLGPRVLDLARLARKGVGLSDLARPVMRELVRRTGQPVLLTRLAGSAVVCLEREEAAHTLRLSYERGQVLPVNAGAAAQVLLAYAPKTELDEILSRPLARFTEATVTEPEVLRARLTAIRERGWAASRGERDPDVLGVAAPVRREDGTVVAAISIAALSHRVPEEEVPALASAVREAAAELSADLARTGLS
ncbi:IclR family transcriptional regulator [Streptomyces sp. DSM 44917]|uniref:IclR family transcriptional regulator n=1 Tax=Streptomyces boetiae TaxID=3075541 RepID=A0ABU2L2V7_9ACTN|nr:IclR family transcriptional regulator [Streptomyces sp. DSM 44917]MDT0305900.1 IclR family transcriptional regulator [Streptomyces sp. DSM 44917]